MGISRETFRGNPNKLDEDYDDEIEYYLDEEENMFGPQQYIAIDFLNSIDSDEDDDDDDDIYLPEDYTSDSDDDISDLDVMMDSDIESK